MLKLLTIITLMVIGSLWAAGQSCYSCGSECAPVCGTRRFRTCCFNYLRRKRGPELLEPKNHNEVQSKNYEVDNAPVFIIEGPEWLRSILRDNPHIDTNGERSRF